MARIRKIAIIEDYPNGKIAAKVASTVLENASAKLVTRTDLKNLAKSDAFVKATRTVDFLNEVRETAKAQGAFYVLLKAAPQS
jgi:hypothetical protein